MHPTLLKFSDTIDQRSTYSTNMDIPNIFEAKRQVQIVRRVLLLLSLVIGIHSYKTYATRVSDKIYTDLQRSHYCSRRLNSTHQLGCQSNLGGNLGIIWMIEDESDLEHVLKSGSTPPYVAIMKREHFNRKNILNFKYNLNRISGVVYINDNSKSRNSPYSPDYTCPNRYSGLYVNDTNYGDCKVNHWQQESPVSGLLYDDIPFPIFLIKEKKSIDDIASCFEENNVIRAPTKKQAGYPLCGIQLDSFMLAASDTKSCLNSRSLVNAFVPGNSRCIPVDNYNIFSFYKPTFGPLLPYQDSLMKPSTVEAQSIVMLVAKLSSLSMFADVSPGSDSTITSIITLLAVADALSKVKNNTEVIESRRNIVFALLDAEPFDYTGSSRMIQNMETNSFPSPYFRSETTDNAIRNINLTSIDYILNLDQLAMYPNSSEIFLHYDPGDRDNDKLKKVTQILKRAASSENIKFISGDSSLPLPPTSVQNFIKNSRLLPKSEQLFGFVLSNYGKTYTNLFYNSIYDDSNNIYQGSKHDLVSHLTKVANFIAKGIYELTFKVDKYESLKVDRVLISDLLDCYLESADCGLFTKAWHSGHQLPAGPISTYKDPTNPSNDMNGAISKNLLVYFLGDVDKSLNQTSCKAATSESLIYSYDFVNGQSTPSKDGESGVCIRSQVLLRSSESPAYSRVEDEIMINETYPAWTFSYSNIRNPPRLYLEPSQLHQWSIFLIGVVITIGSFVIVYHFRETINHIQKSTPGATST